ncbi:MAG TPA: transporter [Terriglobales bacterium]|nr:transporter [Terriglobales bacterium]
MSSINSGITPPAGFTYSNQLLFYSRNQAKSNDGTTLPISGNNSVLMDLNSLIWVSARTILGGAHYSAIATLPFAGNDLTTDIHGNVTGGSGFADSYYVPLALGWTEERSAFRVMYGFLAPTGRFAAAASDNVGSGYWTHALSSGQTFYLSKGKSLSLSAFEMYELHTVQESTRTHPGQTFDLDYSMTKTFSIRSMRLQVGGVGYHQRQTTATNGPTITPEESRERYRVNALGLASTLVVPSRKLNLGVRFFEEFANRATFQGYSFQISGAISF